VLAYDRFILCIEESENNIHAHATLIVLQKRQDLPPEANAKLKNAVGVDSISGLN